MGTDAVILGQTDSVIQRGLDRVVQNRHPGRVSVRVVIVCVV
jgi:hypothetical protein